VDFDVDVSDTVFYNKFMALRGYDCTVVTRKRSGFHPDPEDCGDEQETVVIRPNVEGVETVPLHLHRVQKGADLGIQIVFPDLREWVLGGGAEPLQVYCADKGIALGSYVVPPVRVERLVDGSKEFLQLLVCVWASGHLPWSGAAASDQDWGRAQASVIELGLRLG